MVIKLNGDIIKNEPVLITGLVSSVLALLLAFGFSVSDEQIGAIMAVVTLLLAIVARMFVSPKTPVPPVEAPPV